MEKTNLTRLISFADYITKEDKQENTHKLSRPIMNVVCNYNKFCDLVEEKTAILNQQLHDDCLDACLNKIETDAGSLKFDDVIEMITDKTAIKDDESLMMAFIYSLAMDYIENKRFVIENLSKKSKDYIDPHSDKTAKSNFCNKIAHEVMEKIIEATKKK